MQSRQYMIATLKAEKERFDLFHQVTMLSTGERYSQNDILRMLMDNSNVPTTDELQAVIERAGQAAREVIDA